MKYGWAVVALMVVALAPSMAQAQLGSAAVYGEYTATHLQNAPLADYIYGATTGLLLSRPELSHHMVLSVDIQGRFVNSNGETLHSVTFGPRLAIRAPKFKLNPFIEFNGGFGQYSDASVKNSADNLFGGEFGVTRPIASRLSLVVDYSYMHYAYRYSLYAPQSYSAGLVFYLKH
jgi:hypothetical protein